jgi:LDH2 family malate/lactate/ureidoglycolate dehydrogenase
MTEHDGEFRLQPDKIRGLCVQLFEKVGVIPSIAELIAENLILADLRGIGSHGISRVHIYCQRVMDGMVNPGAKPYFVIENENSAVLDACNGFGVAAGIKAMDWCIEKAGRTGIACCAVRNSNHYGIAAFYAARALPHDMIGMSFTTAPPTMAPWGSITPMLGTNPFCYAVPAGKYRPLVLDCATSVVARGKINLAEIEHKEIPLGWAMDRQGNPTTNATEALKGSVLPFGTYKGSGISIIIDIFCSLLSGSLFGSHIGQLYKNNTSQQSLGHFFCVLDISKFCSLRVFKERMEQMIYEIKDGARANGTDEIYLPGEIEFNNEVLNKTRGIAAGSGVIGEIEDLCKHFGLSFAVQDFIIAGE